MLTVQPAKVRETIPHTDSVTQQPEQEDDIFASLGMVPAFKVRYVM